MSKRCLDLKTFSTQKKERPKATNWKYEDEKFPIDLPDPIEAIKFRMEQSGLTQTDLANIVGQKSRASEILNRKRKLSLDMIRQLHKKWHIPTEVLVQAY